MSPPRVRRRMRAAGVTELLSSHTRARHTGRRTGMGRRTAVCARGLDCQLVWVHGVPGPVYGLVEEEAQARGGGEEDEYVRPGDAAHAAVACPVVADEPRSGEPSRRHARGCLVSDSPLSLLTTYLEYHFYGMFLFLLLVLSVDC